MTRSGPKAHGRLTVVHNIEGRIFLVRGHKIMFDSDLARTYLVTVTRLNEQVKRNRRRFPPDFMFQLTAAEAAVWRSQIATAKRAAGGAVAPVRMPSLNMAP